MSVSTILISSGIHGPSFSVPSFAEIEKYLLSLFTDMILLLCSYDHQYSLINVRERWIPELKEHNGNVPIFLVAAKSDLKDDVDSKVK